MKQNNTIEDSWKFTIQINKISATWLNHKRQTCKINNEMRLGILNIMQITRKLLTMSQTDVKRNEESKNHSEII